MPLVSNLPPPGAEEESVEEFHDSVQVQHQTESNRGGTEEEKDSGYEDFDEQDECLDSDMEGSVMNRPRPKKANKNKVVPPAIPQRNERRASRILDNMMLELKSLDGTTTKELEQPAAIREEDPHELYLSSEEDASLSDDYEDSILDLELVDSNENRERPTSSRASSRKSQEDTARVVSFIVVGKPQIIDIYIHSSPANVRKRHSLDLETLTSSLTKSSTASTRSKPTQRRPSPLKLFPNSVRRLSVSSTASGATTSTTTSHSNTTSNRTPAHSTSYIYSKPHSQSVTNLHQSSQSINGPLPPRKSSRIATNFSSLVSSTKSTFQQTLASHSATPSQPNNNTPTHSFLNIDPFEAEHNQSPVTPLPTASTPTVPKTPTGVSSSAWKMSRGLSRTLSKARKPSMPKINLAYTNGVLPAKNQSNTSKTNLVVSATEVESSSSFSSHNSEKELRNEKEKEQDPKPLSRRSATMPTLMNDEQVKQAKDNKVRYEDIMRNVIKAPPPPPLSPKEKKGGMSAMMGLGRRKSIKGGRS